MTTPIVPSITDEQLAEIIASDFHNLTSDSVVAELEQCAVNGRYCDIHPVEIAHLLKRLRAAEADVERRGKSLSDIITEVDMNIRPTVRDIINGMPDANDIYGYCDAIDRIALAAMERKLCT